MLLARACTRASAIPAWHLSALRWMSSAAGFGLTEEQHGIQQLAKEFGQEKLLPYAADWDEQKIFPTQVLKEAASLGFAGGDALRKENYCTCAVMGCHHWQVRYERATESAPGITLVCKPSWLQDCTCLSSMEDLAWAGLMAS